MRKLLTGVALAVALVAPHAVSAQNPGQGGGPPGGGGGGGGGGQGQQNPAATQRIDLATARRLVDAAQAAAAAAGTRVSIAVVDANGDLVHFVRMDGAAARAVTASQAKARAAIVFGMPTKAVSDAIAAGQPVPVRITGMPVQGIELMTVQGGLPIMRDGRLLGAIGIGGATAQQDEQFGQAALAGFR